MSRCGIASTAGVRLACPIRQTRPCITHANFQSREAIDQAARLPGLIKDMKLVTVEDGPHNIAWTHPEVVNPALLAFLAGGLEAVDESRLELAKA